MLASPSQSSTADAKVRTPRAALVEWQRFNRGWRFTACADQKPNIRNSPYLLGGGEPNTSGPTRHYDRFHDMHCLSSRPVRDWCKMSASIVGTSIVPASRCYVLFRKVRNDKNKIQFTKQGL